MFLSKDDSVNETALSLVDKMAKFMKNKAGYLLETVHLKGNNGSYYWSLSDKKFVYISQKAEFYIMPWGKDDKGRLYLFSPYLFASGVIIMVPEEDIEFIGFN